MIKVASFLTVFFSIISCEQSAENHLKKGDERLNQGDPQTAMAEYNMAIELNANYSVAYNSRSMAKFNLHDYQGALADLSKAIEIDPNYSVAYFNRGELKRFQLYDKQGALSDYTKAIEMNPKHARAYMSRGDLKLSFYDPSTKSSGCLDLSKAGELGERSAYTIMKTIQLQLNKIIIAFIKSKFTSLLPICH